MTPPAHDGAEDSVRLLLTKNPGPLLQLPLVPGRQFLVAPGRQLARCRPPTVLTSAWLFFKMAGSSSGVTPSVVHLHCHVWWAKWTSTARTHGVNHRVPLGPVSHFGPVRHEWLYPHNLKYHWNAQALPRRQRGDTVVWGSRYNKVAVKSKYLWEGYLRVIARSVWYLWPCLYSR